MRSRELLFASGVRHLAGPCINVLFRSAPVFLNVFRDVPVFFDSETGKSGVFQTGNIAVFWMSLNRDVSVVHGPRQIMIRG